MQTEPIDLKNSVKTHLRLLKHKVFRTVMIAMGVLLVLLVFVLLLVFVIPRTNIFRLDEQTENSQQQQLSQK